jgi:hypothetical protein
MGAQLHLANSGIPTLEVSCYLYINAGADQPPIPLNGYMMPRMTKPFGTGSEWLQANVTFDSTTPYFDPPNDGFRPRTVLFGFRRMWDRFATPMNIARPRMNYFRAFVDRRYFNPATWLDTEDVGYDNESQIMALMKLSGESDGFFQFGDFPVLRRARKTGQTDRDTAGAGFDRRIMALVSSVRPFGPRSWAKMVS